MKTGPQADILVLVIVYLDLQNHRAKDFFGLIKVESLQYKMAALKRW